MRNNSPIRATNTRRSKPSFKKKNEILAGLGGGHEHTLRELNDALTVIKVLKAERDKLRKQIAQGGFRQPSETKHARTLIATVTGDAGDGGGTINALIANAGWAEKKKPETGSGHASAQVAVTRTRRTRRCSRRTSCSPARTSESDDER